MRAMIAVVVLLAACGGTNDGDGSNGLGMTGDAYCCEGTQAECDAGIAGNGRCGYGDQGCSPDGSALCVVGGSGPVCTRGRGEEGESSVLGQFKRACVAERSCDPECVPIAIFGAKADGTPTDLDYRCVTAEQAATCF